MTRLRIYGEDTPFTAWARRNPELDSREHCITINDVDVIVHRYKPIVDGMGTRRIRLMMLIENKSQGGWPTRDQWETLFVHHQLLNQKKQLCLPGEKQRVAVWHFGVHLLRLSGTDPDNSEWMEWCSFDAKGDLKQSPIDRRQLTELLRFDLLPETITPLELRRHHKTRILQRVCGREEGYLFPQLITVKKQS